MFKKIKFRHSFGKVMAKTFCRPGICYTGKIYGRGFGEKKEARCNWVWNTGCLAIL